MLQKIHLHLHEIAESKNYDLIKKMLIFNCDDVISYPHIIERIYGKALCHSNERIISLINLFVRENNIKIDKYEVLRCINSAQNQKYCEDADPNECSHYRTLDRDLKLELNYIHKYWNMFEVK